MKEIDSSNWLTKYETEQQLPNPEDLIPLSQTLITPHLALAFNIPTTNNNLNNTNNNLNIPNNYLNNNQTTAVSTPSSQQPNNSNEFDSSDLLGGDNEPARTLKRPRLVWTPQLHKRFVDAVAHLGIKNAVPKTIMQMMSVDGLTRENVASHLQKYRLYLKRMQGLSSGGGGSGGYGSGGDSATDRLFASLPVPAQILQQSHMDGMLPYMPVAVLQQQGMGVGVMGGHGHGHGHGQHLFNRHFGSPVMSQGVHRVGNPVHGSYVDEGEYGKEKKALTLFPNGDD